MNSSTSRPHFFLSTVLVLFLKLAIGLGVTSITSFAHADDNSIESFEFSLTGQKANSPQVDVQSLNSAVEINQELQSLSHRPHQGVIFVVGHSLQDFLEYSNEIKHLSEKKSVKLVSQFDSAGEEKSRKKEFFTQALTVTISGVSGFVTWFYLSQGLVSISQASLLVGISVVSATYFSFFIEDFHKRIDSSVEAWKNLLHQHDTTWQKGFKNANLFLLSLSLNAVNLTIIHWDSLLLELSQWGFYGKLIYASAIGFVASDIWNAVFNDWKKAGTFKWQTIRNLSYAKQILVAIGVPFVLLDTWIGSAILGPLAFTGVVFSTRLGDIVIENASLANLNSALKKITARFATPMRCEKAARRHSSRAL